MKANEFRIGNLIDYCKQICHVMSVYKNSKVELGYFKDSIGFVRSLDDAGIKPIPITEEWLLRFGFESCKYGWKNISFSFWDINDFVICKPTYLYHDNKKLYYYNTCEDDEYSTYNLEIKYVHQLQNLYFALVQDELIAK